MNMARIALKEINVASYNPRRDLRPGDPEYEKLARSIDEFGCVEPLVWNQRTGNLVGGHQRFKILQARGSTEFDVSVVDLPPEREKVLNLALNKITGAWDDRKLATLLDEITKIDGLDVQLSGFDLPDIDALIADQLKGPEQDEKFDVELALREQGPEVTKPGELLLLGSDPRTQHRLLCGDSTDPAHVRAVMDGHRAGLFATDPPYLVNYTGLNHPGSRPSANKDWTDSYCVDDWDDPQRNPELYEKFIATAVAEAIRPNAAWYCWHASRRQAMVESAWAKHGAFVHQQIIWAKDRPILNYSWYPWQHEPCFFGWVRPNRPSRYSEEFPSTVWNVPTVSPGSATEHPTSKPVRLFEVPMVQHTRPGEVCYEPFAGSGSQVIAAQKLARRCFAIEISPRYCDVIVRRFIALAGESAVSPEIAGRYRRAEVRS